MWIAWPVMESPPEGSLGQMLFDHLVGYGEQRWKASLYHCRIHAREQSKVSHSESFSAGLPASPKRPRRCEPRRLIRSPRVPSRKVLTSSKTGERRRQLSTWKVRSWRRCSRLVPAGARPELRGGEESKRLARAAGASCSPRFVRA